MVAPFQLYPRLQICMYNVNKMLEYFSTVFVTQSYPVVVEVSFQINHRNGIIPLDHFLNGKLMVPRKNIRGDGLSNCGESVLSG